MNVRATHTQTKPHRDWDTEEQESKVEVEATEGDLEQAQIVVENTQKRKLDLCKEKGYESDSNTTKPCKFNFSGKGAQKA